VRLHKQEYVPSKCADSLSGGRLEPTFENLHTIAVSRALPHQCSDEGSVKSASTDPKVWRQATEEKERANRERDARARLDSSSNHALRHYQEQLAILEACSGRRNAGEDSGSRNGKSKSVFDGTDRSSHTVDIDGSLPFTQDPSLLPSQSIAQGTASTGPRTTTAGTGGDTNSSEWSLRETLNSALASFRRKTKKVVQSNGKSVFSSD
jgi:hypothetical protein